MPPPKPNKYKKGVGKGGTGVNVVSRETDFYKKQLEKKNSVKFHCVFKELLSQLGPDPA